MINFSCKLVGRGWIETTLITEYSKIKIIASYLSDAPNDLITALALLLEGENETECLWQDEPGEYQWIFKRQNDSFELKILEFKGTSKWQNNENVHLLFCGTENLVKVAHRVLRRFNTIKIEHTVDGYKDLWGYEFPLKAIDRLRFAAKEIKK